MKHKLLAGWTFQRVLFLGIGVLIIGQSISTKQWLGVGLGSFLILMAVFSIGCASGRCQR